MTVIRLVLSPVRKEEEQEELFLQQLDEIMQEENNCVHLRHDETIQVEPQSSSVCDKPTFCPLPTDSWDFPLASRRRSSLREVTNVQGATQGNAKRRLFSSELGLSPASISRSRFEQLPAENLEKLKKPFVPKNTSKSNKWAV